MRIVLVTNQLAMGGIETNLVRLAAELGRRGHDVTVVSGGGLLVAEIERVGARHVQLGLKATSGLSRRGLRAVAAEADVIHVFSASAATTLWAATLPDRLRRARRAPVVASIMGLVVRPDEGAARTYLRAWATSLGVDCLVLIAPSIERLVRRLPIRSRRLLRADVVGLEDGLRRDDEGGRALRAEIGAVGVPVVTTIGRLTPVKHHELVVAAAPRIADARPDAQILIVGEGPEREALEAAVRAHRVEGVVRFLGERSDIAAVLSATDVYIRPGLVEGFVGITVLEAQMLDVPVVAFATEDVTLAITDGVSGDLVPNGDVEALAQAVIRLLDDEDRRTRLAAGGREHVRRFAIGTVVDGLEAIYRSLDR